MCAFLYLQQNPIYMNKQLLALLLLPLQFVFAQTLPVTLTNTDMPTAGWSQRIAKDTLPLPTINFGSAGANRTWDFSALAPFSYDTTEYRALTTAQQNTYPNANLAITSDGVNFLMTRTTVAKSDLQGLQGVLNGTPSNAVFSPVDDIYRFPTQYNGNFASNWGFVTTVPGSAIGQPLVYQIRVTFTANFTDTIDGWGKTVTPVGAYKSLRQKRIEYSRTIIDIKLTAISQFSNFSDTRDTTLRYNYLSKETKGNILNFDFDSLDNVRSVTYSLIPPAAPIADFSFTNPSGGLTAFTDLTDGYPDSYVWDFGDGSPNSSAQNPNHIYTSNGNYEACLTVTGAGGSTTHCDTVRITGITTGNNAPVAFDDTVSLNQGGTIIFHVAGNDIDPDGDNVCMTSVWGSTFVTEQIGGSCDMVLIAPDTCFSGTFTFNYAICDNGNPALCDTGLVTATVVPDASLVAQSFFDISQVVYDCSSITAPNASTNYTSSQWIVHVQSSSTYDTISSNNLLLQNLSNVFSPIEICLTVSNQCSSNTFCNTYNAVCDGLYDVPLSIIKVYPNPASQQITVSVLDKDLNGDIDVVIADIQGRRLKQQKFNSTDGITTISVNDLAAGFYTLTLQNTNGQLIGRSKFTISK